MEKKIVFVLKDQNGQEVKSEDIKDKKILLSFHPLAWTSVCAKQMQSIEKNYKKFLDLNTVPFGISVDPQPSKKAWAQKLKIKKLQLLSDFWPHGEFSSSLDLFIKKFGFTARANVILDENKKIIFKKIYPIKQLPDIKEIISFLNEKNKGGEKL